MTMEHVTHFVTVTGPSDEIARFKREMIREGSDGYPYLDFNGVIKMPSCLHGTECTQDVEFWLVALGHDPLDVNRFSKSARIWKQLLFVDSRIKDRPSLRAWLENTWPNSRVKAEVCIKAERRTGYYFAERWASENWGTKWNAYAFCIMHDTPDKLEFQFNTAWCSPTPVLEAVHVEFPALTIAGSYKTETSPETTFAYVPDDERPFASSQVQDAMDALAHLFPRWRHKKSGATYKEMATATLQASDLGVLQDGAVMILYRSKDGQLYVRARQEFMDGRFVKVSEEEAPDNE